MTLGAFQDAFARALLEPDAIVGGAVEALAAQPGFSVYRNTVLKGCIDALQANYPAVVSLVGEEWFRAAAAVFTREHHPRHPMLLEYGEGFADFLARFPPAAQLPYLADVARLDRYWTEAHVAGDEPVLPARSLAGLPADVLSEHRLRPHVSARWAWFPDQPIATLWQRNRGPDAAHVTGEIDWRGEGILILRPQDVVVAWPLHASGCAFMDACAHGATLGEAAMAALCADACADLSALLATLLEASAFASLVESVALEDVS